MTKPAELPHPDPDLEDPKRRDRLMAKAGTLISTIFRQIRTETRNAQLDRVRQISAPRPAGPDGQDHALDLGPAALARPSGLVRVGGRIGGAGQRDATPIMARGIKSSTLFERLNAKSQISDRLAAAGKRLWMLRWAAKIDQPVTAEYPIVRDEIEASPDEDGADELEDICPEGWDPRTYHRWVLKQVTADEAVLLEQACEGRHPGTWQLEKLQRGLDKLATVWGIAE